MKKNKGRLPICENGKKWDIKYEKK